MIRQNTGILRIDAKQHTVRSDNADLQLPSPHFVADRDGTVFEFFDEAQKVLLARNSTCQQVGQTIRELCGVLHLRRLALEKNEWVEFVDKARQHPLCKTIHRDAFTYRSFSKPRGYAGDAVLLDMIYGTEHFWPMPDMDWVGQRIYRWSTVSTSCEAVKCRRQVIAQMIDEVAKSTPQAEVMSLAAGHFREAELSPTIIRKRLGRMIAIDSDEESLQQTEQDYGRFGVQSIHASARDVMSGKLELGEFDFVYTSGLCDYLSESMCQRLAANLFSKLKPGGKLLLTNFMTNIETVGYMEVFMDWNLIYRDRMQMMQMTSKIPERMIRYTKCFAEENYNVIFLLVERT